MNKIKTRLLAATALALTAGFFAQPLMAGTALPGDIIVAQASSSDPGSRKGDVSGTQQSVPATGSNARSMSSPTQQTAPTGAQPGDVGGTQTPVPTPAARNGSPNSASGGSAAQLGDVSGTQQPTANPGAKEAPGSSTNQRSVAVPTQCSGEPSEQARAACLQRSSTEQGKPGGR